MNRKSQSANFPLTSGLNYMTDPCASTTPVQAVLGLEPQVSEVLSYIYSSQIKKIYIALGAIETAQQVEALAIKSDKLNSIPETQKVEGEN